MKIKETLGEGDAKIVFHVEDIEENKVLLAYCIFVYTRGYIDFDCFRRVVMIIGNFDPKIYVTGNPDFKESILDEMKKYTV